MILHTIIRDSDFFRILPRDRPGAAAGDDDDDDDDVAADAGTADADESPER
jgi:hypothetical protein